MIVLFCLNFTDLTNNQAISVCNVSTIKKNMNRDMNLRTFNKCKTKTNPEDT